MISQLDLVFCVDLTGSMGPFLEQAKRHMKSILESLKNRHEADLRVGLAGYRDYSTQGGPTERFDLNADVDEMQGVLSLLKAWSHPDNTDAAEAVFAGVQEALNMSWREKSYRIMVLVGDAPPHGCGANRQPFPDRYPDRDPTGLTLLQMAARVEMAGVTLYALGVRPSTLPQHDDVMEEAFRRLAGSTGGSYRSSRSASAALETVRDISSKVFAHLSFDRQVYESGELDPEKLAQQLGCSLEDTTASLTRLQKRKLLDE